MFSFDDAIMIYFHVAQNKMKLVAANDIIDTLFLIMWHLKNKCWLWIRIASLLYYLSHWF